MLKSFNFFLNLNVLMGLVATWIKAWPLYFVFTGMSSLVSSPFSSMNPFGLPTCSSQPYSYPILTPAKWFSREARVNVALSWHLLTFNFDTNMLFHQFEKRITLWTISTRIWRINCLNIAIISLDGMPFHLIYKPDTVKRYCSIHDFSSKVKQLFCLNECQNILQFF